MKKILYTLGIFCSIFFSSCNESMEIEVPEATPTIENDGADITFTPEQLRLPGKKGVCLKLSADVRNTNIAKINQLGAAWNYSWGYEFVDGQPEDKEFIPMFWGKNSVTSTNIMYLKEQILNGKCKRVLGFNEPDGEKQANMTVEQALELWPQLQSLNVPLGSPSVTDNQDGKDWLAEFMKGAEERGYRVDFIGVHNYGAPNATSFKNDINYFINTYNLPVLITEFSVADWGASSIEANKYTPEQTLAFMKDILPWLEQNDMVLGYAWFHSGIDSPAGWPGALYDADGNLTACGEYYRDLQPGGGDGSDEGDGGDGGDEGENPSLDPNNLVLNPGFENDKENWTGNSGNSVVTENPISGSKTLKINGAAYASAQQIISTVVEPGATYKFGCTGRVEGGKLQIFIRKPNDNKTKYTTPGDAVISSTENTEVSHTVTIPDGVTQVEIIMNKTANQAVYVDDVYFIKK